jgi:hypothetical protein
MESVEMAKRDPLLEHPLLIDKEVESLINDVRATAEGKIQSIVGTDFWNRAMAEMNRRQINLQIKSSRSIERASWALAVLTFIIAVVAVIGVCSKIRRG